VTYLRDGDRIVVFASKGGSPTNPDWYYNLRANPRVTVELGTEAVEATAYEATGEERERLWTEQKTRNPAFAKYEQQTSRQIPVVVLTPQQ
jgi:deazaflavin-dependent oxidoreductase (nitroreductase family)